MSIAAYALIVVAISIIIILIVSAIIKSRFSFSPTEEEQKRFGRYGEKVASDIIRSVLNDEDYYFTNINISFNGNPAELDNVIVNKYGVFIIEVKNYKGKIVGTEDEYEWKKFHTNAAGNTYLKNVKNPIRQVNRQSGLLANYLRDQGVNVWVTGYAMLLHNNSPVNSEKMLTSTYEIDRAIHTFSRKKLDFKTIESVVKILSYAESRDV